jgi:putative oxidoreductase
MMPAIDSFLATWSPRVLSILRIMVGLLFLEHGMSKYLSLPVSPSTGVAPMSLSGINGMIELVGGVLIVLGLFTRPVAFILAGDMAVAYFIAHAPRGFFPLLNAGELAITCSSISQWRGAACGASIIFGQATRHRRPRGVREAGLRPRRAVTYDGRRRYA